MTTRTLHVEHAILNLVHKYHDPQGYPLNIGTLTQMLLERLANQIPDLNQREIVEALERLSGQYLAITKHSSGRWKRYPEEVVGDLVFFRGDFRLTRTPYTEPRLEHLSKELGLQGQSMTSIDRNAAFARLEKLGFSRVKSDLEQTGGMRDIGGPPELRELAWEWLREQEGAVAAKARTPAAGLALIAESRIDELRKLSLAKFDFRKLIRLCEEINIAYAGGCHFATAMLTRALLDHVPPIFGKGNFDEVADHHGGKSVKEALRHLNSTSKSVAHVLLHEQIGKHVTLPTAQQVDCRQPLDLLLAEIVKASR